MKILVFSFLLIFLLSTNAALAPIPVTVSVTVEQDEDMDWSALFPQIPNCERKIEPLVQTGEIFEQVANYRPQSAENSNPPVYYGCGSIALRVAPSAIKSAKSILGTQTETPFFRKRKIKTFDAFVTTPLCGNDDSRGSISVYFDENKVLIVSAKRGAGNLLEFAESADYELLKNSIDEFIKSRNEKN